MLLNAQHILLSLLVVCACRSMMKRVATMPRQVTAHPTQQQQQDQPAGLAGWQQHLQQQAARRFVRPSRVRQLANKREQQQAGLLQVLLLGL
jgi:hypothetical protein